MRVRSVVILTALALTACTGCIDLYCIRGFHWNAHLPAEWTREEVEAGSVRLCVRGACEDRLFADLGRAYEDSDGTLWSSVEWHVNTDVVPLIDGDRVSITLFAEDGSTIMGIAETPVTYDVTTGVCDVGTCMNVYFEGSTL